MHREDARATEIKVATGQVRQWNPGMGWDLNSIPGANTWANGSGAIKKQQRGAHSSDETSPITAATRGNRNVKTIPRMKKRVPLSAIDSNGPVSHPPLNSVPSKPFVS